MLTKKVIISIFLTMVCLIQTLCISNISFADDEELVYMENIGGDFNDGLPPAFEKMNTARKLERRSNTDASGTWYCHNGTPSLCVNLAAWEYAPIKISVKPDTVYYMDMDVAAKESGSMYIYYASEWNISTNKPSKQGIYFAGNMTEGTADRSIVPSAEGMTWYNVNAYIKTEPDQTEMYLAVRDAANKVRYFTVDNLNIYALPKSGEQAITKPKEDISAEGEYSQRLYMAKNSVYELSADISVPDGGDSDKFGIYVSAAGGEPELVGESVEIGEGETKNVLGGYVVPDSLNKLPDDDKNGLYRNESSIIIKSENDDSQFIINNISAKVVGTPKIIESKSGQIESDTFNTKLRVCFDQKLNKSSAENIGNYLSDGGTIKSAELSEDMTKITLTFDSMLDKGEYNLKISGLKDNIGRECDTMYYGFAVGSDVIVAEPVFYYDYSEKGGTAATRLEAGKALSVVVEKAQNTYDNEMSCTVMIVVYKDGAPEIINFNSTELQKGTAVKPLFATVNLPKSLADGEYTVKAFVINSIQMPSALYNGVANLSE